MEQIDIIQQKEWNELSDNEKSFISDLAPDQMEFNLVKKMLLVADDNTSVPLIDAAVKQNLLKQMPLKSNKVSSMNYWFYAAAAIVILILFVWLIKPIDLNNNKTIVNKDTKQQLERPSVTQDSITIVQPKVEQIAKVEAPLKTKKIVPKESLKRLPESLPIETIPDTNNYVAISRTVEDNPALLSLVTEVY